MIILRDVSKKIGENFILKKINLSIKRGEFVAIIGQSGSGKSSLLNIIGTLDEPSFGSFFFENYELKKLSRDAKAQLRREKIGFIFQKYNLLPLLNSKDNVALSAVYAGKSRSQRDQRAGELLKSLGLEAKMHARPNELSGGQQQRVSIARALMNGGDLILADEPTGALDSKSGARVLEILKELHQRGHTIVLVTHDASIAAMAGRVIEIKDGVMVSDTGGQIPAQMPVLQDFPREKMGWNLLKNQLLECFKIALFSIISRKLRSLLTMLGIIIALASVVCVVALGLGSEEKILKTTSALGTNTIEIRPGRGFGDLRSGRTQLNFSDLQALRSLDYVQSAEPLMSASGVLTFKSISLNARMLGVGVQGFDADGLRLEAGRLLNAQDLRENANVAVLDFNAKKNIFPQMDAGQILGKVVIFDAQPFRVIGILQRDARRSLSDNIVRIYIPYTTLMHKITGERALREIIVRVSDSTDSALAESAIVRLLELKRGRRDFFTFNLDSFKEAIIANKRTTTLLTTCVALIALIVGGIGVMNIMLVSVSERTREIGIRSALGARRGDILVQFLIEAVMICVVGAILGILLSLGIIFVFNLFAREFEMILSFGALTVGIFSSVLIGVIFGFFPARGAANLNPIRALSEE